MAYTHPHTHIYTRCPSKYRSTVHGYFGRNANRDNKLHGMYYLGEGEGWGDLAVRMYRSHVHSHTLCDLYYYYIPFLSVISLCVDVSLCVIIRMYNMRCICIRIRCKLCMCMCTELVSVCACTRADARTHARNDAKNKQRVHAPCTTLVVISCVYAFLFSLICG